jgi:hypothetical protein
MCKGLRKHSILFFKVISRELREDSFNKIGGLRLLFADLKVPVLITSGSCCSRIKTGSSSESSNELGSSLSLLNDNVSEEEEEEEEVVVDDIDDTDNAEDSESDRSRPISSIRMSISISSASICASNSISEQYLWKNNERVVSRGICDSR